MSVDHGMRVIPRKCFWSVWRLFSENLYQWKFPWYICIGHVLKSLKDYPPSITMKNGIKTYVYLLILMHACVNGISTHSVNTFCKCAIYCQVKKAYGRSTCSTRSLHATWGITDWEPGPQSTPLSEDEVVRRLWRGQSTSRATYVMTHYCIPFLTKRYVHDSVWTQLLYKRPFPWKKIEWALVGIHACTSLIVASHVQQLAESNAIYFI